MKLKIFVGIVIFNTGLTIAGQAFAELPKIGRSVFSQNMSPSIPALNSSILLENILTNQSLQLKLDSMAVHGRAVKSQADTWLAGEINMIVNHENDALSGNQNIRNWELGLNFPVQMNKQRQGLQRLADSYLTLLPSEKRFLQWQASALLRQLVWQLRYAQAELQLAQSALSQSQLLLQKVAFKVAAGESPKLDLLLAKKQIFTMQNQIISKQGELKQLQSKYQAWTLSAELPSDYKETESVAPSLTKHPRLVQLENQYQLSLSQQNLLGINKNSHPNVSLGIKRDRDKSITNTSLFFELSVPIQNSPTYSVKQAQQRMELLQRQTELKQSRIMVETAIEQAVQQLNAARQGMDLYKQQMELSRQALQMSERAYQLGESNIQNLLTVQQQSLEAAGDYVLAQIKLGQTIANVNQAKGHIIGEKYADK